MPATNQNLIQDKIKRRINSINACIKVRVYRTIILLAVLYGCKSWPLKLREEHRLRMFENRVLRRLF
jgi:hypothetical protein